jgi:hypothetical protein
LPIFYKIFMEIWKDIIGYEGLYQISNLGKVKSLERFYFIGRHKIKTSKVVVKEKFLVISTYKKIGYQYVVLSKGPKAVKVKIHRLIALHFIPNPNNFPQINHINAVRSDNRIENLEWCTQSHNMKHKFLLGNQSNALGNNAAAKKVKNIKTGEVFDCIISAANSVNLDRNRFTYRVKKGFLPFKIL